MLIEAAQSRPPSSLGPSDSADNLGKENDDLLLAHAQYPPPSMLYDLTVSPASGVLSVQRGRRHGVLLRRKLRLSSTFGQVGVRLRSQSLHHACPACAFLAGVEKKCKFGPLVKIGDWRARAVPVTVTGVGVASSEQLSTLQCWMLVYMGHFC